ncbi:unnamed protein product, partial [Mesorhabditis spiculigera]
MTDYMAQMLDELMGPSQECVCKSHLVGFCPNELFRNTKADLGICHLRHDERFKEDYKNSPKFEKLGYEEGFIERLRGLDREVKRRIDKNMQRLESGVKAFMPEEAEMKKKEEDKITEMAKKIEKNLVKIQELCEQGNVAAGEELLRENEVLEQQQEMLKLNQEEVKRMEGQSNDPKPMHVCKVCGCYMLVNDAQSRIDDHLMGKMHLTYGKIRETIEEWDRKREEDRKRRQEEREKRDKRSEKKRDDRDEKKKKRSRSRSRSKERKRSKERYDRDHHRSSSHRHHGDRKHHSSRRYD